MAGALLHNSASSSRSKRQPVAAFQYHTSNKKTRPVGAFDHALKRAKILFDLGFFELNMLAGNWIIFTHDHFVGHGPGVLFGNVEVASVSRGNEPNLDGRGFSHEGPRSLIGERDNPPATKARSEDGVL
jgi:hypothetical protein